MSQERPGLQHTSDMVSGESKSQVNCECVVLCGILGECLGLRGWKMLHNEQLDDWVRQMLLAHEMKVAGNWRNM